MMCVVDTRQRSDCFFTSVMSGIILESENKNDPSQTQQKTIDLLDLAIESGAHTTRYNMTVSCDKHATDMLSCCAFDCVFAVPIRTRW